MKYLHTMVRVSNPESSLDFYQHACLKELRRYNSEQGVLLVFLAAPGDETAQVELTYNWILKTMEKAAISAIWPTLWKTSTHSVSVSRPSVTSSSRDGRMAFVRSPDNICIELLAGRTSVPC